VNLREANRYLHELASAQHGVLGTRQLDGTEVTGQHLQQLVDRGSLIRLAPQVYRFAGVPSGWRGDLAAGLHCLGPTSVVSHRAAAQLLGLDRFVHDDLEFSVARRRRGAFFLDAVVHTTLILPARDVAVVDGLRTTNAVRTVIDLAAVRVSTTRLEAAVDSALRLGLASLDAIAARLEQLRGKGRRGVRRLDRVLASSGGHSFLEREFIKLVDTAGLPTPAPQVVHRREGRHVARVDFLFEEAGVVVEVSGGRGHSSASDRAKDARRRNELQRLGRLVLEYTYEDMMSRRAYVVDSIRTALR